MCTLPKYGVCRYMEVVARYWHLQVLEFAGTGISRYGICGYEYGKYWNLQALKIVGMEFTSKEIAGMEITGTGICRYWN